MSVKKLAAGLLTSALFAGSAQAGEYPEIPKPVYQCKNNGGRSAVVFDKVSISAMSKDVVTGAFILTHETNSEGGKIEVTYGGEDKDSLVGQAKAFCTPAP